MKRIAIAAFAAALMLVPAARAPGQHPKADWQAELSTLSHGVSGTVTIVDEDTYRVDDFYYDAGGIVVYFYLGADDTYASYQNGLSTGPQLVRQEPYEGETLVIDLPDGASFDDWGAVSVWCVAADVDFGSGAFEPWSQYLPGDANGDLAVTDADYTIWADNFGADNATWQMGDFNGDDLVTDADYTIWADNFGAVATTPAPAALAALAAAAPVVLRRRRG